MDSEQVRAEVCRFIESLIGRPVLPSEDLRSIGVDSIAFLELVIFLEKQVGIPLPLQILTAHPVTTVEALLEQIVTLTAPARGVTS